MDSEGVMLDDRVSMTLIFSRLHFPLHLLMLIFENSQDILHNVTEATARCVLVITISKCLPHSEARQRNKVTPAFSHETEPVFRILHTLQKAKVGRILHLYILNYSLTVLTG